MRSSRSSVCLAIAVMLGPLLTAASPTALADQASRSCAIAELPLPGPSDYSDVTAADPSGRWMTGRTSHDGSTYGVVWHNGKPSELDLPYDYASPGGVNHRGVVAGNATLGDVDVGFVVDRGVLTELALPEGFDFLTITGISRRGVVSGWAMTGDGSTARAYVWSLDDPMHPTRLPLPPGFATSAGSSPDGHIAVQVSDADGGFRSFIFSRQLRRTELHGTAEGYDVGVGSIADGWVAGREQSSVDAKPHYLRWDLDTMEPEIIPLDLYDLSAVNELGVVGSEQFDPDGTSPTRPILYGDHVRRLDRLTPDQSARPTIVTEDGDAAGVSEAPGSVVAVRWDCAG